MNLFEFDKAEKVNGNYDFIIGTDEAGRGPAAGGVWAAAVCFRENIDKEFFKELNDSKKLTAAKREKLFDIIKENSIYSIKMIDIETIEKINILNSSLLAMKLAINDVKEKLNNNICVLVDGNKLIKDAGFKQKFIVKGDSKSASIAAASILAKVERDRFMDKIALVFPNYDWKNNKGYLTKKHIEAIKKYGITKFHRPSFLKNILETKPTQMQLF